MITLTKFAAKKVTTLLANKEEAGIRAAVQGGGCSGFSYGFRFDSDMNEDDANFDNGDVTLVIDSLSYQYLQGSTVDYTEG